MAVWLSEGSRWTIFSLDEHYINTDIYIPLKGSSYIQLPKELKNLEKGLINLSNKDDECFRWCHIRNLNPQEKNPQKIKKSDEKIVKQLNYEGIEFPVAVKEFNKIEKQNNININVSGYENQQFYPIYVSKETNQDILNLFLITQTKNQHYVLIKDINKLMYNQTKHKCEKHFCMHCLQCFSSEDISNNHETNFIKIACSPLITIKKCRIRIIIISSNSKTSINNYKYHL